MIAQCMRMVAQVLVSCITWFEQIFDSSGATGLFLSVVFFLFLKRYLLDPLFRGAGSDKASKPKKE